MGQDVENQIFNTWFTSLNTYLLFYSFLLTLIATKLNSYAYKVLCGTWMDKTFLEVNSARGITSLKIWIHNSTA